LPVKLQKTFKLVYLNSVCVFTESSAVLGPTLLSDEQIKTKDVFQRYYALLRNLLQTEKDLYPYLVSAGMITPNDLEDEHKLVNLILQKVQLSIEQSKTKHLNNLLTIMEQHGTHFAQDLSQIIRKDLS